MRNDFLVLMFLFVIVIERPMPNVQRPTLNSKAVSSRVAVDDEGPRIRAVDHTFYLVESFLLSGILHRLRGSG